MPLNVDSLNAGTISQNGTPIKPYKVYSALLTQTGTDAPVATVLENSLGGEVTYEYWTEESPGSYKILSNELFNGNVFIPQQHNDANDLITFEKDSNSQINIFTTGDDLITNLPIEIRVYN